MEPVDRREFMKTVAGTAAVAAADFPSAAASSSGPVFLTTWEWGRNANERAAEVFRSGGSLLDAVERGINVVEDDPSVTTVGYGGLPNAEGVVEELAALMERTRERVGSVGNLHMIKKPSAAARQVIDPYGDTTLADQVA